jgi:hypothetical protein
MSDYELEPIIRKRHQFRNLALARKRVKQLERELRGEPVRPEDPPFVPQFLRVQVGNGPAKSFDSAVPLIRDETAALVTKAMNSWGPRRPTHGRPAAPRLHLIQGSSAPEARARRAAARALPMSANRALLAPRSAHLEPATSPHSPVARRAVHFTAADAYERHLVLDNVVDPASAAPRERFEAFARSVRDVLSQRWIHTENTYARANPKRVYYLSMEFLIGRALASIHSSAT